MLRGECLSYPRGKQWYPVGPPNQKRPKEQTQHPVRNKTLFLRKVSICNSSDIVCDKKYGSHAAGIWEGGISRIRTFVALIKDAGVA